MYSLIQFIPLAGHALSRSFTITSLWITFGITIVQYASSFHRSNYLSRSVRSIIRNRDNRTLQQNIYSVNRRFLYNFHIDQLQTYLWFAATGKNIRYIPESLLIDNFAYIATRKILIIKRKTTTSSLRLLNCERDRLRWTLNIFQPNRIRSSAVKYKLPSFQNTCTKTSPKLLEKNSSLLAYKSRK